MLLKSSSDVTDIICGIERMLGDFEEARGLTFAILTLSVCVATLLAAALPFTADDLAAEAEEASAPPPPLLLLLFLLAASSCRCSCRMVRSLSSPCCWRRTTCLLRSVISSRLAEF